MSLEWGSSKSRAPALAPGHPSHLLSALPWVFGEKKKKKKIFKEANGSADIVLSKLESFGKLLRVYVAFVDVLSSKHLLFSICIGLPKVTAFTS